MALIFSFPSKNPTKITITTTIHMKTLCPIAQKQFKPEGGQIYKQQLAMPF